jgi:hypothetical protein
MVRFSGFSGSTLDRTQRAPICLSLEQHPPLRRVGVPPSVSLLALRPVSPEGWIIGSTAAYDFDTAGHRGGIERAQVCLLRMEGPGAIALAVASVHPSSALWGGRRLAHPHSRCPGAWRTLWKTCWAAQWR